MKSNPHADFERFARSELDGLLRYALMLTGDRELAGDLVQDVMVKAFQRWSGISVTEHPRAYVRTMITNSFLSWRRSWSVRAVVASEDLQPPPVHDHSVDIVERDEVYRRLAVLSRRQRAVLVLRYYERLTDAEIAEVLGCAIGTVRSNISRALVRLRLPDDDADPDPDDRAGRHPDLVRTDAVRQEMLA